MAPEILKGQGHGREVDWWSFGILLYTLMVGHAPFYSDNTMVMYQMIMTTGNLTFPEHVPADAQSLIAGLLERAPDKRLVTEEIRAHPFFSSLDLAKLEKKQIPAPFVPSKDDEDTKYFDTMFTGEDVRADSIIEGSVPDYMEGNFKSFAYNKARNSIFGSFMRKNDKK